jgi:outer membrane protein assembly factor BamA
MRRAFGIAVVVTLCSNAVATAAVDDFLGKVVASVRLDIEGRPTSDPAVTAVVETRVGRPLSMMEARESIAHLFSLGRFEDVRLHADPAPSGVALRYELVPIHHVASMDFRALPGTAGIDPGRLRRAVVDRFGLSPAVGRAEEVAQLVADTLRQTGYLHSTVTPSVELKHAPDQATLVFTIDPGPRTLIGNVDVVGKPSVPVPDLLKRLKLERGRPYEREQIDERIEKYVEGRRARGYYESRLVAAVEFSDQGRVANLTLNALPGPRVKVVFTGDPLPAERRDELVESPDRRVSARRGLS